MQTCTHPGQRLIKTCQRTLPGRSIFSCPQNAVRRANARSGQAAKPFSRLTVFASGFDSNNNINSKEANGLRRVGWISFWTQMALSIVSAIVLFFTASTAAKGNFPQLPVIFNVGGVAAGFISTFLAFTKTRIARNTLEQGKQYSKSKVANDILNATRLNLIGMGATIIALQSTVGGLVGKALTSSSTTAYNVQAAQNAPAAIDVFAVQHECRIEEAANEEFRRLGETVYADHAGAALYSEVQLADAFKELSSQVAGNPHSLHNDLNHPNDAASIGREMTMQMCNASLEEYDCVFASGATGAMQLLADSFPWSEESSYAYSRDNHTSVLGIREVAMRSGASILCTDAVPVRGSEAQSSSLQDDAEPCAHHLYAYPLESNFDGTRYPESLASTVQSTRSGKPPVHCISHFSPRPSPVDSVSSTLTTHQSRLGQQNAVETSGSGEQAESGHRWWVLVDAAKACATRPPDLSLHKPAFLVLSYYKIFGYPTGLGALLIRKDAQAILRRQFFGGGTVEACSATSDFVRRRDGPAGLENGTPSFLGISALPHGFSLISRLGGFPSIHAHACRLARHLAGGLKRAQHYNGRPICIFYSHKGFQDCEPSTEHSLQQGGGTMVTLNFLRWDGSYIGYREVEKLAGLEDIRLRGGCFCNPGACSASLGLSDQDIQVHHEAGHVCWDDQDIVEGKPTGAIRLSFGLSSRQKDVHKILREFALVNALGTVMTLKRYPQLAAISCSIDLEAGVLEVTSTRVASKLTLQLPHHVSANGLSSLDRTKPATPSHRKTVQLCAQSCTGMEVRNLRVCKEVEDPNQWFSQATGVQCSLIQQQPGHRRMPPTTSSLPSPYLGFANEAQILLLSQSSLDDLGQRLQSSEATRARFPKGVPVEIFRPNILIEGGLPFEEDLWETIAIGSVTLKKSDLCARCEVICVDHQKGARAGFEPLRSLAQYRKSKGRITFGILLQILQSTDLTDTPQISIGSSLDVKQ